jgi:hypothetical protein
MLLKTIENFPKIDLLEMSQDKPNEFLTKSLDGISKMPILSKKYIVKQFSCLDFDGDD